MTTCVPDPSARVRALQLGADDVLVKPYDLRELVARIDAVTRRYRSGCGHEPPPPRVVHHGAVCIDLGARRVEVDEEAVTLTKKEFDLLALLARQPGVTVPRERILREVWGDTYWKGLGRSLEVHVASIRSKLRSSEVIETVRGVGYRLTGEHS